MSLPRAPDQEYGEYRDFRQYQLFTYCEGALLRVKHLEEVVGIALEPYQTETISVDFFYIRVRDRELALESAKELEALLEREGMSDLGKIQAVAMRDVEFPFRPSPLRRLWRRTLAGIQSLRRKFA
jgi:hypothetical protein